MNHRILGSGAIACSAVVAAQWVPFLNIPLPGNICKETEPPTGAASSATVSQKCSPSRILSLLESLPEQFKLQWSQNRSAQLPGSIEQKYQQLIEQAQTLASENRVAEAIVLMNAIPNNSRYYNLAYQMQETWSQDTLHEATSHYQQANLSTALKLIEVIPATSSQYPQATRLKQKWQKDDAQIQRAIAASKAGSWQEVIEQLEALKDRPLFQSLPVQELLQLAMIKVLEPDPTMTRIASTMDSSSLGAAPLPPASYPAIASSSLTAPPPPPANSFSFNMDDIKQVFAAVDAPLETAKTAKTAKPARQAVVREAAPLMPNGTSTNARRVSLSTSATSVVKQGSTAIAEPELMM